MVQELQYSFKNEIFLKITRLLAHKSEQKFHIEINKYVKISLMCFT
jgi:hypothetical protein